MLFLYVQNVFDGVCHAVFIMAEGHAVRRSGLIFENDVRFLEQFD